MRKKLPLDKPIIFPDAADYIGKQLWVLRKNDHIKALYTFEPTIKRMAPLVGIAADAIAEAVFLSSGVVTCGWETVPAEWSGYAVITK